MTTTPSFPMYDAVVFIGRQEPPHRGHGVITQEALAQGKHVIFILGSAFQARSVKNPFTWEERAAMIQLTVAPADRSRLTFIPVRDYYNHARWVSEVTAKVKEATVPDARIGLIGHNKDSSSSYLWDFKEWPVIELPLVLNIHSTAIRKVLFSVESPLRVEGALAMLHDLLHPAVCDYLRAWMCLPHYVSLCTEFSHYRKGHQTWETAPFAPMFVTVDNLVLCSDRVLLITRKHHPGIGLFALPGGFLEQEESLFEGALRELQEETNIAVLHADLLTGFKKAHVFSHPGRSLRGRTITHVHHFDLGARFLPEITPASDAVAYCWMPLAEVSSHEAEFFEDHFSIIQHICQ
ncbi:MAG: bifunctional nicotinamide-nucleotide adenylyltransferase/Nudix hydroxylase [Agitococcus sp.]|nr:bifunctional nicotinamide-nucleotide adenylyltransferase/Nudix hydroxylase [Agitococcus sp.]